MQKTMSVERAKGIFTMLMVLAHSVQLLGDTNRNPDFYLSMYGNLIAFSGFLMCFGYTSGRPQRTINVARIRSSIVRILAAYIMIGLGYQYFKLQEIDPFRVFFLQELAGYGQFLLAFPLYTLLIAAFLPFLQRSSRYLLLPLLLISIFSLSSTVMPLDERLPLWLSLVLPMENTTSFPIVPYLPIVLIGILLHRQTHWLNITRWSTIGIGVCLFSWQFFLFPQRFPVSALWIVTSIPFVLAIMGWSMLVANTWYLHPLSTLGTYSLEILVGTNILFFILSNPFNPWSFAAIMGMDSVLFGCWVMWFYLIHAITIKQGARV